MNGNTETGKYKPTIKDLLLLPIIGDSRASPDGTKIAYRKAFVHLGDNRIELYCYIYDLQTEQTYQLTKTGTASMIRWSGKNTLALRKDTENNFQIFIFEDLIGEGFQVTDHPGGIDAFDPFASGFVFLATKADQKMEARRSKFGNFVHVEEEESLSALYYIDLDRVKSLQQLSRDPKETKETRTAIELSKLLKEPLKIESFYPSTSSNSIFINCRSKDDLVYEDETSCFQIIVDPNTVFEEYEEKPVSFGLIKQIALPKGARIQAVSPDGSKLLFSHKERELKQYVQTDLWILDLTTCQDQLDSSKLHEHFHCITRDLDQEPIQILWSRSGIYVSFWSESSQNLARVSESGDVEIIDLQGLSLDNSLFPNSFFVSDGGYLSFRGNSTTSITDIYLKFPISTGWELKKITKNYENVENWDLGSVESIKWTSKDGIEIEGVLHKPSNFDPRKKYPLLFLVHGGPAATSPKCLLECETTYPTVQLVNRDILILKPNYRGSLGRGQAFLELNVDNLGIGDMWDLESAIDHLAAQGFIDETKIGSMGWSQGGYISAFVAMHSTRFRAVSAGAALSSWYTYFSGSDNRNSYNLTGNPFENRELYEKTAPMSGINTARTPVLFQHGENDQRVPVTSGLEMFRALKAKGISTAMFVYPGKGHGWLEPRENFALLVQNYRWFSHHLLDEDLNFFVDDEGNSIN
ncbi:MAG: prolyl oligopeptidase family serine peptidase [Candidatus Odinarchaeota archaeon]